MVAAYVPASEVRGSRRDGRPMFIDHPGPNLTKIGTCPCLHHVPTLCPHVPIRKGREREREKKFIPINDTYSYKNNMEPIGAKAHCLTRSTFRPVHTLLSPGSVHATTARFAPVATAATASAPALVPLRIDWITPPAKVGRISLESSSVI